LVWRPHLIERLNAGPDLKLEAVTLRCQVQTIKDHS
jgi:hypothetical protein